MVTGDANVYRDWDVLNRTGGNDGVNRWATTDTAGGGRAFFGCNCNDPTQTWDDEYGQWWRGNCRFGNSQSSSSSRRAGRLVPSQQNFHNIYPIHAGGVQALMGDGSVRMVRTGVSIPAWSAAVTPNGGEVGP